MHYGDITDPFSITNLIKKYKPDELIILLHNLMLVSFEIPEYTSNVDALGTLRILEAIVNSKKKLNFIKQVPELFEKFQRHLKQRKHLTQEAHMVLQLLTDNKKL